MGENLLDEFQVLLLHVFLNPQEDRTVWKHQQSRTYSIRSFICLVENKHNSFMESHNFFNKLWSSVAPPRVELLVWFAILEKLKTKDC